MDSEPIKAEQLSTSKWRVLAIPFGGPFKGGKDLDGERFSIRTDIKPDWFNERPTLWHHGGDEELKDEALGIEDDLERNDREGWWGTVWLNRSNRYWEMVSALLAAGKVYGSSGALGHLVKKAPDGEILVWPHIEQTLTTTPSNPFARVVPAKAVDHFTSAGIATDAYKALFADLPDLGPDLPKGGEDSARARLAARLSAEQARLKTI